MIRRRSASFQQLCRVVDTRFSNIDAQTLFNLRRALSTHSAVRAFDAIFEGDRAALAVEAFSTAMRNYEDFASLFDCSGDEASPSPRLQTHRRNWTDRARRGTQRRGQEPSGLLWAAPVAARDEREGRDEHVAVLLYNLLYKKVL